MVVEGIADCHGASLIGRFSLVDFLFTLLQDEQNALNYCFDSDNPNYKATLLCHPTQPPFGAANLASPSLFVVEN